MDSNQNLLQSDLIIDDIAAAHLKETAKWAKFLGIVGFVLSGILVIVALFAGTFLAEMSDKSGGTTGTLGAGMITVLYLLIAVLYFFLSLYLYRFAVKMQLALDSSVQEQFNDSLKNLKSLYRIMGIVTVVYLALVALAMIVAVIAAAMAG